jgi:hypothetical protein
MRGKKDEINFFFKKTRGNEKKIEKEALHCTVHNRIRLVF